MATASDITSTTLYPVFTSKAAFMSALEEAFERANIAKLREILYRLSNTDTDNWTGDSTARHDD